MKRLFLFGGTGLLAFVLATSCAGDEKVKTDNDGEAGQAGDAAGGSGGSEQAGGGQSQPEGGTGVISGGEGGMAGGSAAGSDAGGAAGAGQGGLAQGGAGGAGVDCPAQPGEFSFKCGEVSEGWSPYYDPALNQFVLDVASLPFPIASGTSQYFADFGEGTDCGAGPVEVQGSLVVIPLSTSQVDLYAVQLTDFTLTDVCGNTLRYDPNGTFPDCNALESIPEGSGVQALSCVAWGGTCPGQCG